MSKIRVLPDILASQVAAGEVVERPASVVKELIENSLDAGAKDVRVEIDRGGVALIRVTDDGCGMSREDALLSLERHATSKLRDAKGLAEISTLGFRGEAMPSIASVCRFRMITRETEAFVGTEIVIDGGTLRDVREAGSAPGTQIEARALFFNLPARRKFLRAESTEAAHVEHQLRLHALAAPTVRFRFRRDATDVLDLPPAACALDRVRHLLGPDLGGQLIALPVTRGNGLTVNGYVLPASHARKGRRHVFVFLNGRPIEDPVISRALAEGFRGAIGDGLYPAAWVWVDIDPLLVDVNVHPAKREVRFHRPGELREALISAVVGGLSQGASEHAPSSHRRLIRSEAATRPSIFNVETGPIEPTAPVLQAFSGPPSALRLPDPVLPMDSVKSTELPAGQTKPHGMATHGFRLLGVLKNTYALLESEDGLVVLDPKAAYERVLYERLMSWGGESLEVQGLLVPILIELDPRDVDLVLRYREALQKAGLEIEPFGGNTLQIASVPQGIPMEDVHGLITDLLDAWLHESKDNSRFSHERVARLLARKAATASEIDFTSMDDLLARLFACELPYCTSDGRPTLIEMSLAELGRRFRPGG